LWDEPASAETKQLHAYEYHQNVTKNSTISGHRIWHKMYTNMHNTGTVNQAIVSQWSPAGKSHPAYMDAAHWLSTSCSAGHVH